MFSKVTLENSNLLRYLGIIIGLVLCYHYADNQIITGDQAQMLYKGYLGAHQGIWQAFGNAASAVGNVPGLLSAWIIGGPLLLWDNPWAPMLLLILLRLISYFIFDSIIKHIYSENTRLVFMLLYWLNPWFLYDSTIYNPAYLCFFTAVHFWSAFKLKDKPNFLYSVIHVLAIAGAMQLHYSWPILAVISAYLLYRNIAKPNWVGVIMGCVIALVSLIPYFQEYMVNNDIHRESERYIGYGAVHVYPVIKAIFYWFRYSSTLYSNRIITDANFDWITSIDWLQMVIKYTWQVTLYLIGIISVVISAKFNWQAWQQIKPYIKRNASKPDHNQWVLLYCVGTMIALIINAMLSPIIFSYWHLILVFPIALLPLLGIINQKIATKPHYFTPFILFLTVYFIVVNIAASTSSNKYDANKDYQTQTIEWLATQPQK